MKVLWFTNTASLGADHLNIKEIGGGWIESLEAKLIENNSIELGISFHFSGFYSDPFVIKNTTYFPIFQKPLGRLRKIFYNWQHTDEIEDRMVQYLKVIEDFKPDIIHIFGTESDFGLIIPKTSIPCVIHLQGNRTVINQKWFSGFSSNDVLKYSGKWSMMKGEGVYHHYFFNKKAAAREKIIFKNCKYFLGRTEWDRRISQVLSKKSKYFTCNEIMRSNFYQTEWKNEKKNNSFTIISVFRNNIYKGLETIFLCKKILTENRPNYPISWEIAGITEEDEIPKLLQKKLKRKINEFGIKFLGPLPEKELVFKMIHSDVFVHASHIDNSPNSLCEAMLLGMPVIATFAGGIPSILKDKNEGLLVQDGDPYAMAGAMLELIENTEYAKKLGSNARQTAMLRHNPDTITKNMVQIYSSVIEEQL